MTPWTAASQASLSFTVSLSLLKLLSIVSDVIQPFHPLSTPPPLTLNLTQHQSQWGQPTISSCYPFLLLPSIFPSIRVFSNELALRIRWPKYWGFSLATIKWEDVEEKVSHCEIAHKCHSKLGKAAHSISRLKVVVKPSDKGWTEKSSYIPKAQEYYCFNFWISNA